MPQVSARDELRRMVFTAVWYFYQSRDAGMWPARSPKCQIDTSDQIAARLQRSTADASRTADGSRLTVSTRSLHRIPSSRLEVSPGCSRCVAHLIGKKGELFRRARPRTSVCFSSFCPSPRLHELSVCCGLCRQYSLQVVVGVLRPPGHCLPCQRHTGTEVGRQARWGRELGKERTWEKARFRLLKLRGSCRSRQSVRSRGRPR